MLSRATRSVRACEECTCAARLIGYVDARLNALEALREHAEQQEYDKMIALLRDTLGADGLGKLLDEGRHFTDEQAISEERTLTAAQTSSASKNDNNPRESKAE